MLAWRGCQTPQTHQGKPVMSWMAAIASCMPCPGNQEYSQAAASASASAVLAAATISEGSSVPTPPAYREVSCV